MTSRPETVVLPDGSMPAHLVLPERGSGPTVVLIQEIFGVNDYVRAAADRLAGLGYVVLCPDLYWRIEPGIELAHDDAGFGQAMELVGRLDLERATADCAVTLAHARALPEHEGGAALAGFCLGGSLAYLAAAAAERPADAVVSYYGSAVPDHLDLLDRIRGPLLLHFGGADPFIPRDAVARVEEAAAGRDGVEVLVQEEAGHAFDNHLAPGFHQPGPAAAAWSATTAFLGRHVPVG
jgi:carboxymethylenebutenolidase